MGFNLSLDALNGSGDFTNIIPLEVDRVAIIPTMVLCTWIVLSNCLFLLVLLANKHLRRPSSAFLLNLCASDLLVGAVIVPVYVLVELRGGLWQYGELLCRLWVAADLALAGHSVYALFMVNVDRLAFLTQPTNYRRRMSNVAVALLVLITWLLAVGVTVPQFLNLQDHASVSLTNDQMCRTRFSALYIFASGLAQYYVPAAFILVANLVLVGVAARMKPFVQLKSAGKDHHVGFNQDSRQDARRTAHTMSVVNAFYVFMWLPFFLMTFLTFLRPDFQMPPLMYTIALYLGYANSGLNPLLWAVDSDVRAGYWNIVWCRMCGRRLADGYSFNGTLSFSGEKKVAVTHI